MMKTAATAEVELAPAAPFPGPVSALEAPAAAVAVAPSKFADYLELPPSPLSPIQCGIVPTLTLPVVVYVAGSKKSRVPGPWLTTSPTCPSGVNSGWWGEAPTGIWLTTRALAGSNTCTLSAPATVT